MEILDRSDYKEYDEFVTSHVNGGFTQITDWAEVKKDWEHEIVVSRGPDRKIRGGTLILIKKLPAMGTFMYSPRGPVCDYEDKEVLEDLLEGAKDVAKKHKAIKYIIDPEVHDVDLNGKALFRSLGFKLPKPGENMHSIQSSRNYLLPDIKGKTKDEMLMSFTQKTRYNIRVALKHGVECRPCGKEMLPEFYRIMEITGKRDGFAIRPLSYFENLLDTMGDNVRLYLSFYQGKVVSGAITMNVAGKTMYVYGASDNEYRNVMPNYLMQWEMIKWALETGCHIYDFMGIVGELDDNNGLYRFKKGFNGQLVEYVGDMEMPIKKLRCMLLNMAMKVKENL